LTLKAPSSHFGGNASWFFPLGIRGFPPQEFPAAFGIFFLGRDFFQRGALKQFLYLLSFFFSILAPLFSSTRPHFWCAFLWFLEMSELFLLSQFGDFLFLLTV